MGGDAGENIREPGLRIDAIHLGGDDQAVHGSSSPSAAIRSAEQPGLPTKSNASQSSLGGIVGETDAPVLEEEGEAGPALQDVIEGFGKVMPAGELGHLIPHIDLKILDQGPT